VIGEGRPDHPSGSPDGDRVIRDHSVDHAVGADHAPSSDFGTWKNDRPVPNP